MGKWRREAELSLSVLAPGDEGEGSDVGKLISGGESGDLGRSEDLGDLGTKAKKQSGESRFWIRGREEERVATTPVPSQSQPSSLHLEA